MEYLRTYTELNTPSSRKKSTYTLLLTTSVAQCLIPLSPISLSFRSLPSVNIFVVVFSLGLLAPTFPRHCLSNRLAALHLSCLSYHPVYFGHGHPHTGHIRGLPQMYCIWVTTQWRHSYLARWRFILYLFLFTPQCVTTTAPSLSCFRNIASAFLIISVARQHSGLYKRRHKAQTIHSINDKNIIIKSCVARCVLCI